MTAFSPLNDWASRMTPDRKIMAAGLLSLSLELIEDPEHWVQGESSVPDGTGGFRYCSLGALQERALVTQQASPYWLDCFSVLAETMTGRPADVSVGGAALSEGDSAAVVITMFNDNHTHDEVVAAWRRAIARLLA